jgi:hypothetical protein
MTVNANSGERTLLLILPEKEQLHALAEVALTRAQASRRELDEYRNAMLLDRQGQLRKIERVDVLGPWGDSAAQRLVSRLTSGWRVSVALSDSLAWSLGDIKELLARCILANGGVSDPDQGPAMPVSSRQQLAADVIAASDVAEIFRVLNLPRAEDALDVL